nr:DUF4157 domain-containing protein [Bacteroidia bacterium]
MYSPKNKNKAADKPFAPVGKVTPRVQTKLKVNQPGDKYEQEADEMADKVMRTPAVSAKPKPVTGIIGSSVQKKFPAKEKEKKDEKKVMRKELVPGKAVAPSVDLNSKLETTKGGGAPLPSSTRGFMEHAFSTDFSGVKIHTDARAAEMCRQLDARAFTYGSDIYFNSGQYSPEQPAGKRLLAHELAHVVQQGRGIVSGGLIQRATTVATPAPLKKKSITEATAEEIQEINDTKSCKFGYFEKTANGVELYLVNFNAKEYLIKSDIAWLKNKAVRLPNTERKTNQMQVWRDAVRASVLDQYKTISGSKDETKLYSLFLKKAGKEKYKKGIMGNLNQLSDETTVPFWNISGKDNLYDVEHMVDWQIAGTLSDNEHNLILLDRPYNRSLGTKIKTALHKHIVSVTGHYSKYFTGVDGSAEIVMKKYNSKNNGIYIKSFTFSEKDLADNQWYNKEEFKDPNAKGNPYKKNLIEIKDFKIPDNHFVLKTTDDRAGYFLPYKAKGEIIGAWKVTTDFDDKTNELKSILFQIVVKDPKGVISEGERKIKVTENSLENPSDPDSIIPEKEENHIYVIQSERLKRRFGRAIKELYGEVRPLSPIVFDEASISGFNAGVKGKVKPTLSILNNVDIDFGIENGEYFITASLSAENLQDNLPKPFSITDCIILISANSASGFSIEGGLGFGIENIGSGRLDAGMNGKGAFINGAFDFEKSLFDESHIDLRYEKDNEGKELFKFGGYALKNPKNNKIFKSARVDVNYDGETFSATGTAETNLPGIPKGNIAVITGKGETSVQADFIIGNSIPGVTGGNLHLLFRKTDGGDYGIEASSTIQTKFPGIPSVSLAGSYNSDGMFLFVGEAPLKLGKFSGLVNFGITNQEVNEKGELTGKLGNKLVAFGKGEVNFQMTDWLSGKIGAEVTPDAKILLSGALRPDPVLAITKKQYAVNKIIPGFNLPKFTLFGIPHVAEIFVTANGHFFFNAGIGPLYLKDALLEVSGLDIENPASATVKGHGQLDIPAFAEAGIQVELRAGIGILVVDVSVGINGSIAIAITGNAGLIVNFEWNEANGFRLFDTLAYLKAQTELVAKLGGNVKVNLDLLFTTINLYTKNFNIGEKRWPLGLDLNLAFPLGFAGGSTGEFILPDVDQIQRKEPEFNK